MSSTERVRTRAQRVASRIEYNGFLERLKKVLCNDEGVKKLLIVLVASLLITIISGSWDQPLKFRLFSTPDRDIVCNTPFTSINARQTAENKSLALKNTPHYYMNDPSKLTDYKTQLCVEMQKILGMTDRLTPEERKTLRNYLSIHPTEDEERQALDKLQSYFEEDVDLANYRSILDKIFLPYEQYGVIRELHAANSGNQDVIKVYDVKKAQEMNREKATQLPVVRSESKEPGKKGNNERFETFTEFVDRELEAVPIRASEVLFGNGLMLKNQLNAHFQHDYELVELLFERVRRQPPVTLSENVADTKYAQAEAVNNVGEVYQTFVVGESLARANDRITPIEYNWLKEERASYLRSRLGLSRAIRFLATFVFNALLLLSAYFVVLPKHLASKTIQDVRQTTRELLLVVTALVVFFFLGRTIQFFCPSMGSLVEIAPIVVFVALTTFSISIVVALTVGVLLSLMLTVSGGGGLETFVPLCGTSLFVAFMAHSVRTRLQLGFLALNTAICAFLLSLATSVATDDSMRPTFGDGSLSFVLEDLQFSCKLAFYYGLWAFLGGATTTFLLPVVELYFHVVTPMQLLEYANPSHQLMIELNQRAPATYNHSLQTSYLAEAAAEAIGARSYLVKVGAYFHDVGKMMNPEYFTENQNGYNIHDDLEPRMSALVIVAHVKDGVNLGTKYRLPREIVDLIEQHHGTMLVSFFYQRALKAAQEEDPEARLDEAPFRYPGPIPQSKEAGILMLSDAVESASRSLTDWSPRRVENLVRKITEIRIEDGQFRDSGLTFGEVQTIQQSLVTSLLASRHTRVKYPGVEKEKDDATPLRGDASKIVKIGDDSQIVKSTRSNSDGSAIVDSSSIIRNQR